MWVGVRTGAMPGHAGVAGLQPSDWYAPGPTLKGYGMVIKYGMHVPVTREQLLAAGAVEPTPQERAEMTAAYEEGRARDARYAAGLVKFRAALAEVSDPVARAVLDLHVENENGDCEGDELAGYEVEEPEWPCETVGTVAAVLGIPVPSRWT